MTSVASGQPPPFSSDSPLPPPTSVPGPIPEATQGTSFTSNDAGNGGGKKRRTLLIVGIALAVLVLGAVSIITALRLQEIGPEPVAPTAPAPAPAAEISSRCQNGESFTTASGKKYCFVVNNDIRRRENAQTACQQYGGLARFLDGETKQDVLDVISRFNQDKGSLYHNTSGGDPDDGAYFADSCDDFTEKFGDHDDSLYAEEGSINCSEQPLSFGRSNDARGRVNDTGDGNGRGAVCELAAEPEETVPNCSITAAPTTLTVGQTGTFAGEFSSSQGSLSGQIFRSDTFTTLDCTGCRTTAPGVKDFGAEATTGTHSWTWTPTVADVGTHTIYCRAWNDAIAECRPPNLVDAPPRFACEGPTYSKTVTVSAASASPSPSPTATACQGSCTVDTDCEGALICSGGSCVNSLCPNDGDCSCDLGGASPTPTPAPTPTPSAAPRVSQPTSGDDLPQAGMGMPTVSLFGAGVVTLLLGALVLLL